METSCGMLGSPLRLLGQYAGQTFFQTMPTFSSLESNFLEEHNPRIWISVGTLWAAFPGRLLKKLCRELWSTAAKALLFHGFTVWLKPYPDTNPAFFGTAREYNVAPTWPWAGQQAPELPA